VTRRDEIAALSDGDALRAPMPGWFRRTVEPDHLIAPGDVIGELDVLGRVLRVVARHARGFAKLDAPDVRRAVGYGDVLVRVVAGAGTVVDDTTREPNGHAARAAEHGLVFRAPTSGRFYGRPGADKPPFVTAGAELAAGATVCLLEVMKTFHRVAYGGADVPPRARVRDVLVGDGDDVNAGDALLALEAL
jgi:acetyl-CoA carboxylase biotin carboxyl carrier protein